MLTFCSPTRRDVFLFKECDNNISLLYTVESYINGVDFRSKNARDLKQFKVTTRGDIYTEFRIRSGSKFKGADNVILVLEAA